MTLSIRHLARRPSAVLAIAMLASLGDWLRVAIPDWLRAGLARWLRLRQSPAPSSLMHNMDTALWL